MNITRRTAAKAMAAAALAPLFGLAGSAPAPAAPAAVSPINVILPETYDPGLAGESGRVMAARLGRAVMDTIETHYKGRTLPVWHKDYASVDLEKRVMNICHWITQSVEAHRDTYPLDPAWIAAQIMTESFFYEYAVSHALAVGICQFITPTAKEFSMVCAGTRPEHAKAPYSEPQWAAELERYYERREAWKKARRKRDKIAGDEEAFLKLALEKGLEGQAAPGAADYLAACKEVAALEEEVDQARTRFSDYLEANFAGRSIFEDKDVAFFKAFDERVLYKKPVDAMVLMLARFVRARGGNILTAAAGYHSGLSNTRDDSGQYERYGRIPGFDSTVSYVSRILVNHHEIAIRLT